MKKIISKVLIVALLASMLMTVMATTAFAATTIYITGESVYVRKGPSKDYDARGTVHYGEAYSATSTDKDSRGVKWYKISYKNGTGWVSSRYASTTKPGMTASGKIYATGGSTYVRSSASKSGKILTTLTKGAAATYLGVKQKDSRGVYWYKVSYKGMTGWVSSRYTSTTASSGSSATGTIKATSGSTYIRADYNKEAEIITTLSKGNSVSYLGETRTDSRGVAWYKVQTKSGKTGWVSSKYTTKY